MVAIDIRTRHLRLLNRGDARHLNLQDTNSADLNSARHVQFQEKEKKQTPIG